MKSHEYAKKMQELAEFLLAHPDFETRLPTVYMWISAHDKPAFLAAIRALGAGTKKFTDHEIQFTISDTPKDCLVRIDAPRNLVCKLVRPAEYDCEPFLSPSETEELGAL